jgi:hypothetical protein
MLDEKILIILLELLKILILKNMIKIIYFLEEYL